MKVSGRSVLYVFNVILVLVLNAQASLQEVYQAGVTAYKNGDNEAFLANMKLAYAYRPNHPSILYNLSVAYALNGDKENSIEKLEKVLWMNAELPFQSDEDLASLKGFEPFEKLNKEIELLKRPLLNGTEAFGLTDKAFHPEGIAYSKKTKKFYLGSVRDRKIITVDKNGTVNEFASGMGLMSVMGLRVDDQKGLLWVSSTPAPEMKDFEKGLTAELICFDLKSHSIVERYSAPHSEAWIGDLTTRSDGAVYATSSSSDRPAIYVVKSNSDQMEVLLEPDNLVSLQGITFNENETCLFLADYRYGIFKYELKTKVLSQVVSDVKTSLKGIDGLYFIDGDLIAIHNGVKPFRIVRYKLNESEDRIVGYEFLEKALPEMNEPTLGVIVKDELYYVANSPWAAYNKEKEFLIEKSSEPSIRKVKIQD